MKNCEKLISSLNCICKGQEQCSLCVEIIKACKSQLMNTFKPVEYMVGLQEAEEGADLYKAIVHNRK